MRFHLGLSLRRAASTSMFAFMAKLRGLITSVPARAETRRGGSLGQSPWRAIPRGLTGLAQLSQRVPDADWCAASTMAKPLSTFYFPYLFLYILSFYIQNLNHSLCTCAVTREKFDRLIL